MSTEVAKLEDRELIALLRATHFPTGSDASIFMVVQACAQQELDPMTKPFHIVPMWNKNLGKMVDQIMPGIDYYRVKAHRTNQYLGASEAKFGPTVETAINRVNITYPEWCEISVKRLLPSGQVAEWTVREYWLENYAQVKKDNPAPNAMWRKRPFAQLAKCAEAQALRRGFPDAVGAQPTYEEMVGKDLDDDFIDVTHTVVEDAEQSQEEPEKTEPIKQATEPAKAEPSQDDKLASKLNDESVVATQPKQEEATEASVSGDVSKAEKTIRMTIDAINNHNDANSVLKVIDDNITADDLKSVLKKAVNARMREINNSNKEIAPYGGKNRNRSEPL